MHKVLEDVIPAETLSLGLIGKQKIQNERRLFVFQNSTINKQTETNQLQNTCYLSLKRKHDPEERAVSPEVRAVKQRIIPRAGNCREFSQLDL